MTTLAQYDQARAALAEATRIDEVLPLLDEFELAKVRAKQIKDQVLLADATAFQLRAERRLGQIIQAAKAAGLFKQGRQSKAEKSTDEVLSSRPTLEEAGIDKKLSQVAQKRAGIAEQAFELMVESMREKIMSARAKPINGQRSIAPGRHEPKSSQDFFPTPPAATRALVERVFPAMGVAGLVRHQIAWEPACGAGHMAEVLGEYFRDVIASDKFEYGYGAADVDFLSCEQPAEADWIITNPPFGDLTEKFVLRGLDLARVGVAVFVRLQWLETVGRYERLFRDCPPTQIAFFCERVALCKGHWDPKGGTATAYIWAVWAKDRVPRAPFWIPPGTLAALTRDDDVDRFTAHPVTKRELPRTSAGERIEHALDTGEVIEADAPVDGEDNSDIPPFLRRTGNTEAEPAHG